MVALVVLVLAGAAVSGGLGCQKGTETSLRAVVTWQGLSADQLELAVAPAEGGPRGAIVSPTLRPERATGSLASPSDVIIRLRDELDGTAVRCRASILLHGALQQFAESEPVTVRKGTLVPCTVAIPAGAVAVGVNLPNGAACGVDRQCASRYCVDGLCCDVRCDAACMACDLTTSPGICAFVADGTPPRDAAQCRASEAATCGSDGMCDGRGACRSYPAGTPCGQGRCDAAGASVVDAKVCNGRGACAAGPAVSCAPFACNAAAQPPTCFATCASAADCVAGRACVSGSCGRRGDGVACAADADCQSGHCADGVCCDGACTGACRSCAQPGNAGKCLPVAAGGADPHGACSDARAGDPASCGPSGVCDGLGGCAVYAAETLCGAASCNASTVMKAGTCDGAGACQPSGTLRCNPFGCKDGRCNATCGGTADCATGQVCDGATMSCGLKGIGQTCAAGPECTSGVCADGVCCNEACDGPCRSCALSSSMGICKNTAAGSVDPRGTCRVTDVAACGQDGVCDGNGACRRYLPGTVCAPMTCAGANRTLPGRCDDAGACAAGAALSCTPYRCNGTGCFTSCGSNAECDPPNVCLGGACAPMPQDIPCTPGGNECGLYACRNNACVTSCAGDADCAAPATCVGSACRKKVLGAGCGAGGECDSGNCVDGVCCSTATCDACKACNVPAFLGACANVPAGVVEPHARCAAAAAATCGLDGMCNGAGACRRWGTSTVCAPGVCSARKKADNPKTCDGAGACVARGGVNCAPDDCDTATGACP